MCLLGVKVCVFVGGDGMCVCWGVTVRVFVGGDGTCVCWG